MQHEEMNVASTPVIYLTRPNYNDPTTELWLRFTHFPTHWSPMATEHRRPVHKNELATGESCSHMAPPATNLTVLAHKVRIQQHKLLHSLQYNIYTEQHYSSIYEEKEILQHWFSVPSRQHLLPYNLLHTNKPAITMDIGDFSHNTVHIMKWPSKGQAKTYKSAAQHETR